MQADTHTNFNQFNFNQFNSKTMDKYTNGLRQIYLDRAEQDRWDIRRSLEQHAKEEKEKEEAKQKSQSMRYTVANYPKLSSTTTTQPVSVGNYRLAMNKNIPTEEKKESKRLRHRDDFIEPPFIIRNARPIKMGMLDERTKEVFVAEDDEPVEKLNQKYQNTREGNEEKERSEWDEFEWNADIGIVGRQFDL